jgi:DNA-directed RNA polymerase subunit H (RpoH/RPB5)
MAKETKKQQFEILNHELVPNHELISEDEKKQLFKKYNITPDQLPKVLDTDPVCLSIGAKPGQIVKITRKSTTAKNAVIYRFVVESND